MRVRHVGDPRPASLLLGFVELGAAREQDQRTRGLLTKGSSAKKNRSGRSWALVTPMRGVVMMRGGA